MVIDVKDLNDLDSLDKIVQDKRKHKRAGDKKARRNRHDVKLLIKQQITPQAEK